MTYIPQSTRIFTAKVFARVHVLDLIPDRQVDQPLDLPWPEIKKCHSISITAAIVGTTMSPMTMFTVFHSYYCRTNHSVATIYLLRAVHWQVGTFVDFAAFWSSYAIQRPSMPEPYPRYVTPVLATMLTHLKAAHRSNLSPPPHFLHPSWPTRRPRRIDPLMFLHSSNARDTNT